MLLQIGSWINNTQNYFPLHIGNLNWKGNLSIIYHLVSKIRQLIRGNDISFLNMSVLYIFYNTHVFYVLFLTYI